MTNSVAVTNSDMSVFDDAEIKRAGELLGVPLDRAAAIRALIIQRDTDLSITRGEISVVEFRGKPQVFVNKNGYLAYASKHPDYRGFKCESGKDDNGIYGYAEVYRSGLDVPISVKRYLAEYDMHREPWTSRPRTMIEKVALSQALRMAFPILGGTYDESEEWDGCNRVVVDPLPTDIDVQPTPAPVQEDPPKQAIETYSLEQAQMILENYGANGFDTAVFERARISDREYDKQMIDADFKRQNEAKKAAKKAESKLVQPQHQAANPTLAQLYAADSDRPAPSIAAALPKRLAVFSEADGDAPVSVSAFKELTGEMSTERFRRMHQDNVRTPIYCLPMGTTNDIPQFDRLVDQALLNRLITIPFRHVFSDETRDVSLELAAERDEIFSLMVDELRKYLSEGLLPVHTCARATQMELLVGDELYRYFTFALESTDGCRPGDRMTRAELKQHYLSWAVAMGADIDTRTVRDEGDQFVKVLTKKETNRLFAAVRVMGYEEVKVMGVRYVKCRPSTSPQKRLIS